MNSLLRRFPYYLTPQMEIYKNLSPLVVGKNVLEVGFCTGLGVLQYYDAARTIVAIDINKDMVSLANKIMPLDKIKFEQGDICDEHLGLYDAIIMIEVIEHIPQWQVALKNIYDKLTHDGMLIISTPNANGTYIKNDLHGDEWTAKEFYDRLSNYFSEVTLHDFSLNNPQPLDTRITPLVAVCRKNST